MPDGADTTRDAVAAAFKEVAARAEPAPASEPAPDPSPAPEPSPSAPASTSEAEPKAEPQRDGKGRFIVPPKQKPAASEKATASTASAGQGGAVAPPAPVVAAAPPAPALEALKPPQDWRAQAKEKWGTLPREVQEEALRLHVETKRTLQEAAELRKGFDPYRQAVAPYEAMIRAENLEPHAAIGILLQREAALRTAPMQTRAQIIAHGIRTFLGTDEQAINLLAQALDSSHGQGQRPQAPQQFDPNQLIAQAEQRLMQRLETARNESMTTSAQSELETFANSHEFVNEPDPETGLTLGEDMANLMEAAIGRGKELSFDDAYKLATKRHSVVSKVIGQREAAKAATAKAATTQAARAASSSIRSEPSGPSDGASPSDTRALVKQAYMKQKYG